MYVSREELIELQRTGSAIVVDVRDEDVAGGQINGALHMADDTFGSAQVRTLLEAAIRKRNVAVIIFHCMESARRGPRCARRFMVAMEALRNCGEIQEELVLQVRILEGGFDQWVRRYWRDPERVERYDDNYWGYAEMAEAGGASLFDDDAPAHKCYERPADQPATHWSAAGVSAAATDGGGAARALVND